MTLKLSLAVAALGGAALLSSGCGNDVPSGAVAKVGDATIEKAEFDKWLEAAVQGQAQGGPAAVPDPPDFEKCTEAMRSQPTPRGAARLTEENAKKQCEENYEQLKDEVMQFLIQAEWIQQEADKQDVDISDAEVRRSFEDQKKQAFPRQREYEEFLRTSGMTEDDILFRIELQILQTKLTEKITENEGRVTDEEVEEYYNDNKERFAQPERRDLNLVLTRTEQKAEEARERLEDGESFRVVARELSIDETSKRKGGRLPDVAKGQNDQALDEAVFGAEKGELAGPVETQFGFYVFEVSDITPASQQSLSESKETIKNLLRSQKQQTAVEDFVQDFQREYKDKTDCADDYVVDECSNAPKEKTETGPASGGAPQVQGPEPQGGGTPVPQVPQGGAPAPTPQAPTSP